MDKLLESEIDKAIKLLRDNGYQTYNLWHIEDVKDDDEVLTDEDKMEILEKALTNAWIIEQVYITIDDIKDSYIEQLKNDNN